MMMMIVFWLSVKRACLCNGDVFQVKIIKLQRLIVPGSSKAHNECCGLPSACCSVMAVASASARLFTLFKFVSGCHRINGKRVSQGHAAFLAANV